MQTKIEYQREFADSPDSALLDSKVVSAYIGKSLSWLNCKAVTGGGIPYTKLGHHRRYCKRDVLDWLDRAGQKVTSTSQYAEVRYE